MDRDVDYIPLDGNAAAGALCDVFAIDVTAALVTCNGCGTAAEMGAIRLFGGAMGTILRCVRCDTALVRLARTRSGFVLDLRGVRALAVTEGRIGL